MALVLIEKQTLLFLKSIDIGGIRPTLTVDGNEFSFRTAFGGTISLLVYLLSGIYTGYISYNWMNGEILPNVQLTTKAIQYEEYYFDFSPVDVAFFTYARPVQEDGNIITPLLTIVIGGVFQKPKPIFSQRGRSNESGLGSEIHANDTSLLEPLSLVHNPSRGFGDKLEQKMLITFVQCNETYLSEGKKCASPELVYQFMKGALKYFMVQVNIQRFDQDTKYFEVLPQSFYFILDQKIGTYTQILLRTKNVRLNNGFFMNNIQNLRFISQSNVISQAISPETLQNLFKVQTYAAILISLDSYIDEEVITYPQLGEFLAQFGTAVQILFSIKYVLQYYNELNFKAKFAKKITSYYFLKPKIRREEIYDKTKRIQLDLHSREVQKIANKKMDLFNLFYELSRIQLLLQNVLPGQDFKQLASLRIDSTKRKAHNNSNNQSQKILSRGQTKLLQSPNIEGEDQLKLESPKDIFEFKSQENEPQIIIETYDSQLAKIQQFAQFSDIHQFKAQPVQPNTVQVKINSQ